MRWLAASIAVLLAPAPWLWSQAAELRVYRCTAADGRVSLQDSPCAKDAVEELRTLRRPVDAPPAAAIATPVDEPASAPPPSRPAPRAAVTPLFECVTHEGKTYESADGIGAMRWVPLWVLGLDPRAPRRSFVRTGATPSPPRDGPRAPATAPDPAALGAGTWVQDVCYRLPEVQVCERRRAKLAELRRDRRESGAGERPRLRGEIDALAAQLSRECR